MNVVSIMEDNKRGKIVKMHQVTLAHLGLELCAVHIKAVKILGYYTNFMYFLEYSQLDYKAQI